MGMAQGHAFGEAALDGGLLIVTEIDALGVAEEGEDVAETGPSSTAAGETAAEISVMSNGGEFAAIPAGEE